MDITSEHPTKIVQDLTFRFANGNVFAITLADNDQFEELADLFLVTCVDESAQKVERTSVYKAHLNTVTVGARTVTIYPKGESPLEVAIADHLKPRQHTAVSQATT